MRFLILLVAFGLCPLTAMAQDTEVEATFASSVAVQEETVGRSAFHDAVIKAAVNRRRAGEMTRAEVFKLRVAMLSPAFRDHCEDLAVIQMAASDSENVPTDADGRIDRASIDWDAIIAFIEKLIPLILQLITLFGGGA